ncbi:mannose-1-phosphate guanylyltransferase / mannose-6-phosphate isomerase [Allopseudospirillum japonicum]|uniref:Mannose-1-phosphate guanylyltransferase / mannose-6-phosphate isomerase n=1 Tax=Allopseudospirillum japonicum TaxID=64971 RepID=A0A1H6RHI1_9GAMM|nr:CBS domain-containing protein [Allopseudospirillum japonicum]SEI50632.1 mannose-1-phosphate guanylyltransferase / mannose-6-phosphate isomerase [Allopseudospirillum japonicum]
MLDDLCILPNARFQEVLAQIEREHKKLVLVIDAEKRLQGIITDGDIRRKLLSLDTNTSPFDLQAYQLMRTNYLQLTKDACRQQVIESFKEERIDFLPIVDHQGCLVNLLTKRQFHVLLLEDKDFKLTDDFSTLDTSRLEQEIYPRPWGFYKSTLLTPDAQAKVICVEPQGKLSLQKHFRREEHWIVIKGEGCVSLELSNKAIYAGDYIYIPRGCKHQLTNTGKERLMLAEVQLGDYFGEDDIIRYQDIYGRVSNHSL